MKKSFSKAFMQENCGCYEETEGRLEACSFMQTEGGVSLTAILDSEIPIKDKYWFVIQKCNLSRLQIQQLAINTALVALHIFENKYPGDKRPRLALEAAQSYLDGKISLDGLKERRADAADAAAYAADAAAYAAAYAADAAADAAAYAAADAAALLENLKTFCETLKEN